MSAYYFVVYSYVILSAAILLEACSLAAILCAIAAMFREIRARIGSARLLLGPLVGQPTHAPASGTLCVALLDVIQKSSLANEERATLSGLALGVSWCGDDAKSIADAFVPLANVQRQSMHNFEALPEYFVDSE